MGVEGAVSATIAVLSAAGYLAYRHPGTYAALYRVLLCLFSIYAIFFAGYIFGTWSAGATVRHLMALAAWSVAAMLIATLLRLLEYAIKEFD